MTFPPDQPSPRVKGKLKRHLAVRAGDAENEPVVGFEPTA